ncbi:chemotaxis protein CheA [Marinobacter nanhaiticus D15-8W]|uniref:Chemotaxis protein CheA n=1 Tax=Marinobacter nanhaiticus D15-8W TaxID=626887 RepID=N6W4Y8_9GAMM|nr:chemotaxis protein CheA [Marinobacter nanhaiticus]ENO15214.1 chemotaxis protein CheA [Marinobacter nanhaiticus D15-8W]BES69084.1 chemotaxis protein CheA [Marinobacter nanhaiticus D15-8W]
MNMDQALQTFLDESRELLSDMERILLELESNPGDAEELRNALFRCVHTVKGSAGMFGLDHVVNFTHVVENVLDRLRAEEIELDSALADLLLRCRDHISLLVEVLNPADADDLKPTGDELLSELEPYQSLSAQVPGATSGIGAETDSSLATGTWHISIRVNEDALRHGMDPLGFIRFLGTLGELVSVTTLQDNLPAPDAFDAEACYLGFEIDLKTDAGQAAIEDVFEFAGDLYELHLVPPGSSLNEFMALLEALPEGPERLGEILVATGVLSESALAQCLQLQDFGKVMQGSRPIGEILVEQGAVEQGQVDAALAKQQQVKARRSKKPVQHFRIQADKLDRLINLVGELVISSAAVNLDALRSGDAASRETAANLNLLVEDIRDSALDLRMVPIGDTFQRFQRTVRDVAAELGKDIELDITGADTELDKTVVEKIGDPLTHLVRNACDHGIESPAVREGKGKPTQGTVHLNAYHESGAVVIEVSDDGGGLNRDRILKKAIERELVKADADLSDREVFELIFEPGFSTVDQVTNLSGRGVGMDVVRRNIEALRGMVEVVSPGVAGGTTFRIRLPLTLAIIDGFLARVGEATYVVPLELVVECTELNAVELQQDEDRHYVNLRQEVLPLIRLREHFRLSGVPSRRQNIIVVRHGGQKVGLVVDELLGEQQTVIKPLSGIFAHLKGLSGSTILGSGQVALILDVPALIPQISQREQQMLQPRRMFKQGQRV